MLTAKNVLATLFHTRPIRRTQSKPKTKWTPPQPKPKVVWIPPLPKPKKNNQENQNKQCSFSLFSYDILDYHNHF